MIKRANGFTRNGSYHARFSTLLLEPTKKYNGRRRVYRLREPFNVDIFHACGDERIEIPKGYETDLASIPLLCQVFLGGRDDYTEEAIVHDFLCDKEMPRFFTNAKMRVLMSLLGRPKWKTLCVYYGLMIFGYGSPIFNLFTGKWRAKQ